MFLNRAYTKLPCYTGDISGVCSALYELGGMVVIHDPSGCNSTYNTHDETRWYDRDSLIFISGFSEMDAVLGGDDKLVREVTEAALSLKPRFICLVNSPIPYMSGTDFPAICRLIEEKTGIITFYVPTNGMHDYTIGAGLAFERYGKLFIKEGEKKIPRSLNILGLTPLDFAARGFMDSLRALMGEAGFKFVSCWAMGEEADVLSHAAAAQANLVVSCTGLPLAKYMEKTYGIPYVCGFPVTPFAGRLFDALAAAQKTKESSRPCLWRTDGKEVVFVGEAVVMGSLAAAVSEKYGCGVRVISPLEGSKGLLCETDLCPDGEEALKGALAKASVVVGDPLYKGILPEGVRFYSLPHQAFSGRIGWKEMKDLAALTI